MPHDPNFNDPRSLWQNQENKEAVVTLDDVRRLAARLEGRIYRRNLREYAAGATVIPVFVASLWHYRGWRLAAPVLMIAGTVYVLFQLHRRSSTRSLPEDMGLQASLNFHIRELERQRNTLHTVWIWYLLPFVPGLVAELVVSAVDRGINTLLILFGFAFLVVFVGIWGLNESAARKLDRRIQELREMEIR